MWIVVALLGWAMTGSAATALTGMATVPGCAVATLGLSYRSLTMEEGLRSNTVRSLLQDRDGFIFMGTDNGLCRYDSHEITYYYNPLRGSDPFVSTLHAFGNGLLVGTSSGLCYFDCRTEQFSSFLPRIKTTVGRACSVITSGHMTSGNILFHKTVATSVPSASALTTRCGPTPPKDGPGSIGSTKRASGLNR